MTNAKGQNNSGTVRIEVTVNDEPPGREDYSLVFYALVGCLASLAQELGETSSQRVADLVRDVLFEMRDDPNLIRRPLE